MGFDIPAKAALDTPTDAFNFQITDMSEIMAAPKVFLKHFFVNTKTGEKSGEMLTTIRSVEFVHT